MWKTYELYIEIFFFFQFQCCGMSGPEDWRRVTKNDSLPHTCCPGTSDDDSCTINTDHVYNDSCVNKLIAFFQKYGSLIGIVGLGIAGAQVSLFSLESGD